MVPLRSPAFLALRCWCARATPLLTLCMLALLCLPLPAQAADRLLLRPGGQVVDAWEAITVYPDASLQLSVTDMLGRLNEFQAPARRGGSLGVHKEAMWLRIPLSVEQPPEDSWILDIGYSSLLEVDIYLVHQGEVRQEVLRGYRRPPGPQSLASRTPSMALNLEAGGVYDVLVRIRTLGPMILPITLSEQPYYLHRTLREQMVQGLLNGLACWLVLYSLLQWLAQRDRTFAYYALVVLGSAGFSVQFFGIGAQYLWPGNIWMEGHAAIICGLVALTGSFLFLERALNGVGPGNRYGTVMRAGAAVAALCALAFVVDILSVRAATAVLSVMGMLPSLLSVPMAVRRMRAGDAIGTTLLVAWTVYGAAAAAMVALVQGWIPATAWTLHSFQIGATVDMLLFLRVLGLRARAIQAAAQQALRERDTMHSLAYTDALTGLHNRRGLQQALQSAVMQCASDRLVAVYLMDLDGFKPINDSHGHDVGDELLVAVADRLRSAVRERTDMVARLGGDEFIVMACDLPTPERAELLGRALLQAFDQPLAVGDLRLKVGLTIGYAIAPLDHDDPRSLVRLADAAMYAGKQSGKHAIRRNRGDLALSS